MARPLANFAQIGSVIVAVAAAAISVGSCLQTGRYYDDATRKMSREAQLAVVDRLQRSLAVQEQGAMKVTLRAFAKSNRVELRRIATELQRRDAEGGVNAPEFQESLAALGASLRAQFDPRGSEHCRELNASLVDVEQALESGVVSAEFIDDRLHEVLERFAAESWLYCAVALEGKKAGAAALAYFYFGASDDLGRALTASNPASRWPVLRSLAKTPLRMRSRNELQRLTPRPLNLIEWLGCSGHAPLPGSADLVLSASDDFESGTFQFRLVPQWQRPGVFTPCAYLGSTPRVERLRLWGQMVTKVREVPEIGEWVTVDFGPDGTVIATLGLDDQRVRAEVGGDSIGWEAGQARSILVEWNSLALSPEDALVVHVSGLDAGGVGSTYVADDFVLRPRSP